jgi:hypothetical protein
VRARLRPEAALISWLEPTEAERRKFHDLKGYRLRVERLPLFCGECPPEGAWEISLAAAGPPTIQEGGRTYYPLPLDERPALLRVEVVTVFGSGANRPSLPLTVERRGPIPAPTLSWRWATGGDAADAAKGPRAVLFHWEARREGTEQVIGVDGRPRERQVFYRANLYRRVPPDPWPLAPLNPQPLEATQWIVPPLTAALPARAGREEYALRRVERTGAEGPPSAAVAIPLPARPP